MDFGEFSGLGVWMKELPTASIPHVTVGHTDITEVITPRSNSEVLPYPSSKAMTNSMIRPESCVV